jgi:hypothetical protein
VQINAKNELQAVLAFFLVLYLFFCEDDAEALYFAASHTYIA